MKDFSGFDNTTGAFPSVLATNASGPTLRDGTPITADVINDIWGGLQAILNAAGTTPSGSLETDSASDLRDSIRKLSGAPGEIVLYASPSEVFDANILPLKGQVITIAAYPDLVAATYIGDTDNSSTYHTAFYKSDSSGGVTRSTSGPYFKLPDCRGFFLRTLSGAVTGRDAGRDHMTTTYGADYGNMSGWYEEESPGQHVHDVLESVSSYGLTGQTYYAFTTSPGVVGGATPTAVVQYKKGTSATSMLLTAKGRLVSPETDYDSDFYDEVRPENVAFQIGIRY